MATPSRRSIFNQPPTPQNPSFSVNAKRQLNFNSPAPSRESRTSVFANGMTPLVDGSTPSRLTRVRSVEVREPLKVFLRIRPKTQEKDDEDSESFLQMTSESSVQTAPPREGRFQFTKVFGEDVGQREFFEDAAKPLVTSFLRGGSGIIFAHGMTGSGKTYTIHGRNGEEEGVLPRSLDLIFKSITNALEATESWEKASKPIPPDTVLLDRGWDYEVFVSFLEIYNENVYDLLATPQTESNGNLVRESLTLKDRGEHHPPLVTGLTEHPVFDVAEARKLLEKGKRNRKIAATQMNQASSRSHSIFTVKLVRYPHGCPEEEMLKKMKYCKLAVVDLAGSERAGRTGAAGVRLKEASGINLSLMTFGRVLEALRNNQKAHSLAALMPSTPSRQSSSVPGVVVVPYRESKLTRLVQNYFVSGKAVMIANVSPDLCDSDETLQVLKFSAMAKELVIAESAPQPVVSSSAAPSSALRPTSSSAAKRRSGIKRKADDESLVPSDSRRATNAFSAQSAATLAEAQQRIEELQRKLQAAEAKAASTEANVREEMVRVMMAKLAEQEQAHQEEIEEQLDLVEEKYERKIAILQRLQQQQEEQRAASRKPNRSSIQMDEDEEEESSEEAEENSMAVESSNEAERRKQLEEALEREKELIAELQELQEKHDKLEMSYELQTTIIEELRQQLRGDEAGREALAGRSSLLEKKLAQLQSEHAKDIAAVRETLQREARDYQNGIEAQHQAEMREIRSLLALERREKDELKQQVERLSQQLIARDEELKDLRGASVSSPPNARRSVSGKSRSTTKKSISGKKSALLTSIVDEAFQNSDEDSNNDRRRGTSKSSAIQKKSSSRKQMVMAVATDSDSPAILRKTEVEEEAEEEMIVFSSFSRENEEGARLAAGLTDSFVSIDLENAAEANPKQPTGSSFIERVLTFKKTPSEGPSSPAFAAAPSAQSDASTAVPASPAPGRKMLSTAINAARNAVANKGPSSPRSPRGGAGSSIASAPPSPTPASPVVAKTIDAIAKKSKPGQASQLQQSQESAPVPKTKASRLKDKIVGAITPKRFGRHNHNLAGSPAPSSPATSRVTSPKNNYQVDVKLCGVVASSPFQARSPQRFSDLFDSPVHQTALLQESLVVDEERLRAVVGRDVEEIEEEQAKKSSTAKKTTAATTSTARASTRASTAKKTTTTTKSAAVATTSKGRTTKPVEVAEGEGENLEPLETRPSKKQKVTKESAASRTTPMTKRLRPRTAAKALCR